MKIGIKCRFFIYSVEMASKIDAVFNSGVEYTYRGEKWKTLWINRLTCG